MQVGTAQSQSLIASVSVSTQIQATKLGSKDGDSADAVLLSIGRQIDVSYAQKVLETELGQQLSSTLEQAGVATGMLQDALSGALDMSPEATANRIVDFATSFLGAFQANNAEQGGQQQVDGFAELIRGEVLIRTRDEVPHSVEVKVLSINEREDGLVTVVAEIWVETESQKGILIGKSGFKIGEIGRGARRDIEAELGSRIHLDLQVKVRKKWRRDVDMLDRLGIE